MTVDKDLFKYKVKTVNPFNRSENEYSEGFVIAKDYSSAIKKIEKYYGEHLLAVMITWIDEMISVFETKGSGADIIKESEEGAEIEKWITS